MKERTIYRQVPSFNVIPLEYRQPAISVRQVSLRLLLILLIVFEAMFILQVYQEKVTNDLAIKSTQLNIQQLDKKLAEVNAQKEEAKQLQTTIETLKKEREVLEQDWNQLGVVQTDWSRVITTLVQSKPPGVELSAIIKQGEDRVGATGKAGDYAALLQYRSALLASPVFSRIISLKAEVAAPAISFSLTAEVKKGAK